MRLRMRRVLLVVRGKAVRPASEALHRWGHFESLCFVGKSRKIEEGLCFSWAQRDAREYR
jgi:hypothetical protein